MIPVSCVSGFLGGSVGRNLPAKWETWVQSLGQENPLEKEMATHSNILAWTISWTEEPGGLQSMGLERVGDDWATKFLSIPVLSSLYFVLLFFIESFDLQSYSVNHFNFHKVYLTVWTGSQGIDYRVRKQSDLWLPRSLKRFSFIFKLISGQ